MILKFYKKTPLNIQKDSIKQTNVLKNFLDSLIGWIVIICLSYWLFLIPFFYINTILYGHLKKFAFQIANYSTIFSLLVPIENVITTNLGYPLRYILLWQYKNIIKSNPNNLYNPIGCFYLIDEDFGVLSASKWKIDKFYNNYKKFYINELQKTLQEYPNRNVTKKYSFVELSKHGTRSLVLISIPNRIVLYPQLAYSYYEYGDVRNMEVNNENLIYLKKILNTYDIVYEQEKSKYTINYLYVNIKDRNINNYSRIDWNIKQLNYYYPKFVYSFSTKIIEMEKELYPKTYCSDKYVINKYNSVKTKFSDDRKKVIEDILLECK